MKKRDFAALTLVVTSAILLIAGCQQKGPAPQNPPQQNSAYAADQGPAGSMNQEQQSFYNALSPDSQRKFNELDAKHKQMALDAANKDSAHDANKAVEQAYKDQKKGSY